MYVKSKIDKVYKSNSVALRIIGSGELTLWLFV